MAIQANKFHKNGSLISKCHVIVENSKLNMYSHLVEYSWQTKCLDTLRYTEVSHTIELSLQSPFHLSLMVHNCWTRPIPLKA